jgi:pyridoxine kinase
MNILSIQSHVAYGHVGNSSAAFALQRTGIEVWPILTVQFSNHTGYGSWKGRAFDAATIRELMQGISERGVLPKCDGVLSGYLGSAEIGAAVLDAVAQVRAANPKARYCCDPVIGDVGRNVFVQPGVAEFMREKAVPAADIVTPNHFELDYLTGRSTATLPDALAAVDEVRAVGPQIVLVTSLVLDDTPADAIDLLACDHTGRYRLRTPKLPISVNGAGDAIAALFFAHCLKTGSAADALSRAASSVFGILQHTADAGSREILLIEAQDELVQPSREFQAQSV